MVIIVGMIIGFNFGGLSLIIVFIFFGFNIVKIMVIVFILGVFG